MPDLAVSRQNVCNAQGVATRQRKLAPMRKLPSDWRNGASAARCASMTRFLPRMLHRLDCDARRVDAAQRGFLIRVEPGRVHVEDLARFEPLLMRKPATPSHRTGRTGQVLQRAVWAAMALGRPRLRRPPSRWLAPSHDNDHAAGLRYAPGLTQCLSRVTRKLESVEAGSGCDRSGRGRSAIPACVFYKTVEGTPQAQQAQGLPNMHVGNGA